MSRQSLILLGAILGGIFFIPEAIKVDSIECVSQFGPCPEAASEKLAGFKGSSLPAAKKQIFRYLSADASISDFSMRLKLPTTLLVTIVREKPRFAVKAQNEEIYANLDRGGEVLTIGKETFLPYVVISTRPPNTKEKVSAQTLFALKIQERLYSSYQVRSGELVGDSLKVHLPEGYTVLFPLEGDADQLLGALSLIIYELKRPVEDSRIEGAGISVIDLRFTNPVLR